MHDKQISIGCVVAGTLWVATVGCILAGTIVGLLADADELPLVLALLAHGLMFSAAAATATIRRFILGDRRQLQDAFDLGRAAGSNGRSVSSLR